MNSSSALVTPTNLLQTIATPQLKSAQLKTPMSASEVAKRAAIHQTAQDYEASFLSQMVSQMFEGVKTPAPFGGGEGEDAYKSLLMDAFAKQIAKSGGIGVAASVQREMLKMQGLN